VVTVPSSSFKVMSMEAPAAAVLLVIVRSAAAAVVSIVAGRYGDLADPVTVTL
jgi:hypothetical protein